MPDSNVGGFFQPSRLSAYARSQARSQKLAPAEGASKPLGPLLTDAGQRLATAHAALARISESGAPLMPSAVWILDNYATVRDALREASESVPKSYYRLLPKLAAGPYAGYPRVFEFAEDLATLTDHSIQAENVDVFLQGAQEVDPLTLAELWSLPVFIRVVLACRVAEFAESTRLASEDRLAAIKWTDKIHDVAQKDASEVVGLLADMARERAPLTESFVLEFSSQLRARHGHEGSLAWLEARLHARGTSIEDIECSETQRETQRQGSISNAVLALRDAVATDWTPVVESASVVEQTLRTETSGVYLRMAAFARDAYRHRVEGLARYGTRTEFEVAEAAVEAAKSASAAGAPAPANHVGHWLEGEGADAFAESVGYRAPFGPRVVGFARRHPTATYLGGIGAVTIGGLLAILALIGEVSPFARWVTLAAAFLPLLDFAVTFTNWNVVRLLPPRRLPEFDFDAGIPPEAKTFVVVPTLITSPEHSREMAERLEIHALANPDPSLRFALLTDWADSSARTEPGDEDTLEAAVKAIRDLNLRDRGARAATGEDRFFLLHRDRRWNEAQGVWMGWERKRGKLEEFNDLLRHPDAETTYVAVEGDFRSATADDSVRYVMTLDADTRTTPDGVRSLVATAAHPLNRPRYSAEAGRVEVGYGVLQPRVSISPDSARQTPFARVFAGRVGVDPYTTAVSDAYQDLFGEGIYTGKGLYDVDAFRHTLGGAVPENAVLSHDLLEGNHARAALVSDIEVFDDYPSRYASYASRQHRWTRGDWQLLPWLLPRVRTTAGTWRPNPLSVVGRWKLFDNLRRSLTPPAVLVALLLAWTVLPGSPFAWTLAAIFVLAFPIYAPAVHSVLFQPPDALTSSWLRIVWSDIIVSAQQTGLSVIFLAHQATLAIDAIGRTLWRLMRRRNLLEWTTARQAEGSRQAIPTSMWISVGWGAAVLAAVTVTDPIAWITALPFAAAWIAAPWVAARVSRPSRQETYVLTRPDVQRLRRVARRTWRFFNDTLSEENHWLPPDNLQEQPYRGLARRTSPTNIGLALNVVQASRDLGYLTRSEEVRRLDKMLESVESLDSFRGHLFNWYSTETMEVMAPRYVSTVDSGNLAGSLLTMKQGLLEAQEAAWPNPGTLDGLLDTLAEVESAGQADSAGWSEALSSLRQLLVSPPPKGLSEWRDRMEGVRRIADLLIPEASDKSAKAYMLALEAEAAFVVDEIETVAPWLRAGAEPLEDDLRTALDDPASLGSLAELLVQHLATGPASLHDGYAAVETLLATSVQLAQRADALVREMDFRPMYDPKLALFRIGYDTDMDRMDESRYDLLASEARLASLLAIGKGEVPPEHWFHLGRPTRATGVRRALLSWSGTMFEYLMPALYTRLYSHTLLYDACYNAVSLQRQYGRSKSLPWGVSESAYAYLDLHLTYQYRAFGVPTLGLKRGLAEDYVVAPYATLLALLVRPERALSNLAKLDAEGAWGEYGYYDAIDYTPGRGLAATKAGSARSVVRTYMAHHQGMGLLAVTNTLMSNVFQERFHRDPLVRSVEVLLQERVPTVVAKVDPVPDATDQPMVEIEPVEASVAHFDARSINEPVPHAALLSNGRYSAMVTAEGTGYSQREGTALTRWRGNRSDADGFILYIRDVESGRFWSAGLRPTVSAPPPDRSNFWVHPNKVESARVDDWIETFVETVVSPEDDVEVRRLTLSNYGDRTRTIEVTSYAEVVLQDRAADLGHPAFSKLFVETDHLPGTHALIATRRPRAESDVRRWLVHAVADREADRSMAPPAEFETDRMRFIGRGRTLDNPAALDPGATLSGTVGAVLDPIVSLRRVVTLAPKQSVKIAYMLGIANSREAAERLAERYDHPDAARRASEMSSTYGLVELSHLGLSSDEALYAQELAGRMLYRDPTQASPGSVRQRNVRPQSGLWAYGISGDLPILVFRISRMEEVDAFGLLLKAHALWRRRGLSTDLVVLNDHPPSYADELQATLTQSVEGSPDRGQLNQRGGVFLRRTDGLPNEDVTLLLSAASVVMHGCLAPLDISGPIAPDLDDVPEPAVRASDPEGVARIVAAGVDLHGVDPATGDDLVNFNGYGGFKRDETAYVVRQRGSISEDRTPLPWSNVVANEVVGFLATESGEGYTWARNSQQNKLTPWSNDPVTDPAGEAIYIRDDDARVFWSPTPRPSPAPAIYETTHGCGYSSWKTEWAGIETEMTAFVPLKDPLKVVRLRLTNTSDEHRRLSLYRFSDLVLGERREPNARYIVVERDEQSGAVTARNPFNPTYGSRLAFAAVAGADAETFCASRTSFVGQDGRVDAPQAVADGEPLDGSLETELDPCIAHRVEVKLAPGESREVLFLFGQAKSLATIQELVARYSVASEIDHALDAVGAFWRHTLGAVQISTPAPELDALVNGWLLYQNLSCRVWGRSAFYQSGGAYGFRDQLQDSLALIYTRPDITRAQILKNAAHQFEEGDVLHWWHPITGAGTRTRFSDDLLWLPYAVASAVETTGDASILDDQAPFVTARLLEEGEDEAYVHPQPTPTRSSVFDHCCRAIDRSLTTGRHGLPLMGTGDWNDGMNRVGEGGEGESVWLGFFLAHVLDHFIPLCERRGENLRVERYTAYLTDLRTALNDGGWDGAWYRRAFYDDGTPIGSAESDDCQIDAIAQGWSVISGVATPERAEMALDAVEERLVDKDAGIIRLLTPPFDKTGHDPGYIKGYLPGVRENGGQYTHGVLWAVRAFLEAGRRERGTELLRMLLPANHALTPEAARRYKAEPYAVAADVYSVDPHAGRGGWTWYTGSAGWMWRVAVESLMGLQRRGSGLLLTPRVPDSWPEFSMHYRMDDAGTAVEIRAVRRGPGVATAAELDGQPLEVSSGAVTIPVSADGKEHVVTVTLG